MTADAGLVQAVWDKARARPERNPDQWRQDPCGAWLERDQLDNEASEYGWRMLQVEPDAEASAETLEPFHVANGFDITNGEPRCAVTADRRAPEGGAPRGQPRNAGA